MERRRRKLVEHGKLAKAFFVRVQFCFRLSTGEGAQGSGNRVLSRERLRAFWDQRSLVEHIGEEEFGRSGVTARFVTHGEDGRIDFLALVSMI